MVCVVLKIELLFILCLVIVFFFFGNLVVLVFVISYVVISLVGGVVVCFFDLCGKVNKSELEELVCSVGVKWVGVGKEIVW